MEVQTRAYFGNILVLYETMLHSREIMQFLEMMQDSSVPVKHHIMPITRLITHTLTLIITGLSGVKRCGRLISSHFSILHF